MMKKKIRNTFLAGFVLFILSCLFVQAAVAAVRYQIVDLGVPDSGSALSRLNIVGAPRVTNVTASAINEQGVVAGTFYIEYRYTHNNQVHNGASTRSFTWFNGNFIELGSLNTQYPGTTRATDINDNGIVVGVSDLGRMEPRPHQVFHPSHGFRWSGGGMTDLGTGMNVTDNSAIHAINNNNVAVGVVGHNSWPTKWEAGAITRLQALDPRHYSWANGINDQGFIVGESKEWNSWLGKALLWRPGQTVPENLDPTNLNVQQSTAVDINNNGRIVGATMLAGSTWAPVHWENGQLTRLFAVTPNGGAMPSAVNNLGHVVGYMRYSTQGAYEAFIWTDALYDPSMLAGIYDLQDMIPPNTGWDLTSANDINDSGYIVGSGYHNGEARAFLLIPDDDPTADIDADSNRDGDITSDDDGVELSIPGAIIVPNIDDSNNDGIPDSNNDQVDGLNDELQLSKLIVNQPPAVAPSLIGEARLEVINGPGKIRVFINDGAAGVMILDPFQTTGIDFWSYLAAGNVNLIAEGVEAGDLVLELEVIVNGNRHTDRIALTVPKFELALGVEEPFLDIDGDPFASNGYLEVPADFVSVDYQDIESAGTLNLYASFYREDELEMETLPPVRQLRWKIEPIGALQIARQPKLRDLNRPATNFQTEVTADVVNHISRAQIKYSFPHPSQINPTTSQPQEWIKAGDEFKVTVTADLTNGQSLSQQQRIKIIPGAKYFHITEPPPNTRASDLWRMDDAQFNQTFSVNHFEPPLASEESRVLDVMLLDFYRNPLPSGTVVNWELQGSGYLGDLKTSDDVPDVAGASESVVRQNGQTQIRVTQTFYANCPWQPEPDIVNGAGAIARFAKRTDPMAKSMVERNEAFPASIGPVRLRARLGTTTAGFLTPDIFTRDTRDFSVFVYRETSAGPVPLPSELVNFSSLNGKLKKNQITKTDQNGIARVTLTHEDARPDEEIIVIASLGTESVIVSPDNMQWVTSAPTKVTIDKRILAADKTTDGKVYVDTLIDEGESLVFPGEIEGDQKLAVQYFTSAKVDVKGDPGHQYKVDIVDSYSWVNAARYPFDIDTAQKTPDVIGGRNAAWSNTSLDLNDKAEGQGSFAFTNNSMVTIPGNPTVDLTNGLLIELWVNPDSSHVGTLLERNGQYKLYLIDSGPQKGHVKFEIDGINAQGQTLRHELISTQPLPPATWSFVDVRYDGTSLRLGVGPSKDRIDTSFVTFPKVRAVSVGTPVLVGEQYIGRLDDLRFTTGGNGRTLLTAVGLDPDGTITTDQQGNASFTIQSTGNWDPDQYRPAQVMVQLSGSLRVESEVHMTDSNIIGELINGAKAALYGTESLGKDAGWFERSMAWVSENVPLLSDLRTLVFELYKAGSGCDRVSMMNVTFAAVGIIADVATFGTAGRAVQGLRNTFKVVAKLFIKEFAKTNLFAAVTQQAISSYMRELSAQASGQSPPGWVINSHKYLTSLTAWAQQGMTKVLDESMKSLSDILSWQQIYNTLDANQTKRLMTQLQTLGAELEAQTP